MERSLAREKEQPSPCVAEVCRRFLADEEDFSGEKLKALEITDWIDNTDLSVALGANPQPAKKVDKIPEAYGKIERAEEMGFISSFGTRRSLWIFGSILCSG